MFRTVEWMSMGCHLCSLGYPGKPGVSKGGAEQGRMELRKVNVYLGK